MIGAERRRVLEIRSAGRSPREVVADVLVMLDVEESMLDIAAEERREVQHALSVRRTGDSCADLEEFPPSTPAPTRCARDVSTPVCTGSPCASAWPAATSACCDSSPLQHADGHFHESAHPVMQSAEPGEDWRWCFVHHTTG